METIGSPHSNSVGAKNFTPPFPAYPSGHATFGTAALTVIENFLKERNNVDPAPIKDMVSDEYNGVTIDNLTGMARPLRSITFTIQNAIRENLESRIYLGVHWRFDGDEGDRVGKQIGEMVYRQVATKGKVPIPQNPNPGNNI